MTSQYFKIQRTGKLLHLIFEDAKTRNSFGVAAARELREVIEAETEFDALILSAKGRVFCSGGNLSDYASMTDPEEGIAVNDEIRSVLALIEKLPLPTVCAVGGDVFGGGVELVSCFDHVIAVPHVMFGLWQRKIALTYGWGGGSRLERKLGLSALRNLSLSARLIGADEARNFGLVQELVSESQLLPVAVKRAHEFSSLPKKPVEKLKSFTPEAEIEIFNSLWWSEDHKAVLAPRKKR